MSGDASLEVLPTPGDEVAPPRRRPLWMAALAVMVTLLAVIGVYTRASREADAPGGPSSPGGLLQEAQARGTSLTSVGRAVGLPSPCTAWLLETGAGGSDAAYAVTAGRCVGIDDSSTVVSRQAVTDASIEFNSFAAPTGASGSEPVVADVTQVTWASTRGTDLAVLRLGSTYEELADRGVRAIVAVAPPAEGGQILVAGVPVQGIAEEQMRLRGSRCSIGATVDVAEEPWTFQQMQASDCAGMLEGSAGSPAFNPAGEAVGMVTATTVSAPEGVDCGAGRPCEVGDGSTSVKGDTSYLVAVDVLSGCFPDGRFALGAGCGLEDPASVVAAGVEPATGRPGAAVLVEVGSPEAVDAPTVALDRGRLGAVDCADPAGWTIEDVRPDGTVPVTLPTDEGFALVCVGGPAHPTALMVLVDGTPPDAGGIQLAQVPVDGGVRVAPIPDAPEFSSFLWVSGPSGTIDCAVAEGYTAYRGVPATIEAADLPSTVCVIAVDEAGNPSSPAAIDVD